MNDWIILDVQVSPEEPEKTVINPNPLSLPVSAMNPMSIIFNVANSPIVVGGTGARAHSIDY
jgi:hypothetical protein